MDTLLLNNNSADQTNEKKKNYNIPATPLYNVNDLVDGNSFW